MDDRLFTEQDLRDLERDYADGLSSRQILDLFSGRGIKFSEATFRKYIQLGLLPRSRRIGKKGKNRGSQGMYPATTVRKIVAIKRMMAASYTIEDIQQSFIEFKGILDSVENELGNLFTGIEQKLHAPRVSLDKRKQLTRELGEARRAAGELVKRLASLEQQVVGPLRIVNPGDGTAAAAPGTGSTRATKQRGSGGSTV